MTSTTGRLLLTVCTLGLGCAVMLPPETLAAGVAAAPAAMVETVTSVLTFTNDARMAAGLTPLREESRLMRAAQVQSEQMGQLTMMDHVLPKAPFPKPADRLAAARYTWAAYAENVAVGQPSAEAVVNAWMKSPGHRANILNPNYTELGVGYAVDVAGRPYYAQVFGRPAR